MNGQDFTHIVTTLDKGDIRTIAIIDDIFDPIEKSRFLPSEIEEFFTHLENSDEAQDELAKLSLKINAPDDIDDVLIQELWKQHDQTIALCEVCKKTLFARIIADLDQMRRFCDYLERDLHREVITLGTTSNLDEYLEKPIKLIFVDYYLGPIHEPSSREASVRFIERIPTEYQPKPLIVLMSSQRVTSTMRAQFRDDSGWLQGMFHFISKEDFYQKDKLSLLLIAFATALPTGYKIQHFVEALEKSIKSVSKQFLADIRKLSLNDYAYIQKLSLQTDGHPLGDYMLWLYSAYFGHLLFENEEAVRKNRDEIDKLKFEHLPPIQVSPSLQLAEIYKSALFNMSVGDVFNHSPEVNDQVSSSSTDTPPSKSSNQSPLHLGDLFIKDNRIDVLLVINAECDLAFTLNSEERPFPSEQSIILTPGKLQPLNEGLEDVDKARTELFEYQGEKYRIVWDVKKVVVHPYKAIANWIHTEGFKRVARLRLPFALEIQRDFAASLTRIGMPVAPPIYQPVQVQIFYKGEDNNHALLEGPVEELASLAFTKRGGEQCMLTLDCIMLLLSKIGLLVEKIEEQAKSLDPKSVGYDKKLERLHRRKGELLASRINYQSSLQQLLTPFELKAGGEKAFAEVSIRVCRDKLIEGQYSYREHLLINIISTKQEENNSD